MSKRRSTAEPRDRMKRAEESARRKLTAESHPMPGFVRGEFDELEATVDDPFLGLRDFPKQISDALLELSWDIARCCFHGETVFDDLNTEQKSRVMGLLLYTAEQGFAAALYRYAKHLRAVPELAAWNHKRTAGGDTGRKTQQQRKAARNARIVEMFTNGIEPHQISATLRADGEKCSIPTVYRALKPATSTPRKASKRSRKR